MNSYCLPPTLKKKWVLKKYVLTNFQLVLTIMTEM